MKKLILIAVLGTAAISAENYVVTLDNKHYENNIIVDNGNNSNNPTNEPFDETKGYTGFTLIHTKASTNEDVNVSDISFLSDYECYNVLSDSHGVCNVNKNGSVVVTSGRNDYLTFKFSNPVPVSEIKVDAWGYVNCQKGSIYQISYKQSDGNWIDTGQAVGTYGNSSYSYTNTITINDTTAEIKAQVVRLGCTTGSARVSEFRIYK